MTANETSVTLTAIFPGAQRKRGTLTTNHAASSYGQPVLVIDHRAYGPADHIGGRPLYLVNDVEVSPVYRAREEQAIARWNAAVATSQK